MIPRLTCRISAADDGRALRAVLRGTMGLSASLVKAVKWLPDGILLDGQPARLDAIVREGQQLSVAAAVPAPQKPQGAAPPMPPVLWEDDCLLIVDKPAGLTVHPTAGHPDGTLFDAAAAYLRGRGEQAGAFCPVSRLDRHTSGVLCAAKNRFAAQRLSQQMASGEMHRTYCAVLCGSGLPDSGTVDVPIAQGEGIRRIVAQGGQRAVTHFAVLRRSENRMLVRLDLETGRTHQIRVHMAHLGCPVWGDFLYGTEDPAHPGFALHSAVLCLNHPLTDAPLRVEAPLPPWFEELMK